MSDSRPIVMTSASVRAIEKGLKTATRRVCEPQPMVLKDWHGPGLDVLRVVTKHGRKKDVFLPLPIREADQQAILAPMSYYDAPTLWVKQRWRVFRALTSPELEEKKKLQLLVQYGADLPTDKWRDCDQESFIKYAHDGEWKNPRFMPRWASRLDLDVVSVRLEQLGWMTASDCLEEGIQLTYAEQVHAFGQGCMRYVHPEVWDVRTSIENFKWYWDVINGANGSHDFRPDLWVWAIRFKQKKEENVSC